jgi:hypothetical protein
MGEGRFRFRRPLARHLFRDKAHTTTRALPLDGDAFYESSVEQLVTFRAPDAVAPLNIGEAPESFFVDWCLGSHTSGQSRLSALSRV